MGRMGFIICPPTATENGYRQCNFLREYDSNESNQSTLKVNGGARASVIFNGGRSIPRRCSGRPIPKRGQVKVGIVVGLANSFASIFSRPRARGCASPSHLSH
ncbi:hypothetical protein VNO77_05048 [Canavalia gladiata]|uniref:Uncharacterized protein n=1 Tax=Canavalia gladiata TaxID=3824 RepID=A0AAN9N2Q4_CANGL